MRVKTPEQEARILKAAVRMFSKNLYYNVRMEDIAVEAGVGKGTVYRYFGTKDELYQTLLRRAADQLIGMVTAAYLADHPSERSRLIDMTDAVFAFIFSHPYLGPLIHLAEVLFGEKSSWQSARDNAGRLLLQTFQQAADKGEFRVRDPEYAAMALVGVVRFMYLQGKKALPDRAGELAVNMMLDGAIIRDNQPNC